MNENEQNATEGQQPMPKKSQPSWGLRILTITLITAALVVGGILAYRSLDGVSSVTVELTPQEIPADGVTSALLRVKIISRFGNEKTLEALSMPPQVAVVEGKELVRVIQLADSLSWRIVPYAVTGDVVFHVRVPGMPRPIEARLRLTASLADRDRDGYPDVMELTSESDRSAFRRWFVTVALAQLRHIDDGWNDRDCAGLARYCYREALKRHDSAWRAGRQWLVTAAIPDVQKYNYPNVPLVGTRVFNAGTRGEVIEGGNEARITRPASTTPSHTTGPLSPFSTFAEAARLKDNALGFVGREPERALPGDLLFYLNDTDPRWPYHTMIYCGNGATVYHTGPDDSKPGIMKRMTLQQLAAHPNPRWHPVASNPYFLGFYRWKILG